MKLKNPVIPALICGLVLVLFTLTGFYAGHAKTKNVYEEMLTDQAQYLTGIADRAVSKANKALDELATVRAELEETAQQLAALEAERELFRSSVATYEEAQDQQPDDTKTWDEIRDDARDAGEALANVANDWLDALLGNN